MPNLNLNYLFLRPIAMLGIVNKAWTLNHRLVEAAVASAAVVALRRCMDLIRKSLDADAAQNAIFAKI